MFNTSILDVAIGMVFIYLLLSLLCTATNELIELLLKKRAIDLERGIRELLVPTESKLDASDTGKKDTPDIVERIYDHPLVNSLYGGTYKTSGIKSKVIAFRRTQLPSYIPARNFALALMDTVMPQGGPNATSTPLRTQLENFGNPRLKEALTPLVDAAAGDVARTRANIEEWFNSSMDRVSGWYKRRSHIIALVLGFGVAVAVNADSVLIVRRLASDRALRDSLVASANLYAQEAAKPAATPAASPAPTPVGTPSPQQPATGVAPSPTPTPQTASSATPSPSPSPSQMPCEAACSGETPECKLKKAQCEITALGLPIGWSNQKDERLNWKARTAGEHIQDHLFGWLLTALAISLGAPFWFDLLNKFIVIRSTVKPREKSPEDKSKD